MSWEKRERAHSTNCEKVARLAWRFAARRTHTFTARAKGALEKSLQFWKANIYKGLLVGSAIHEPTGSMAKQFSTLAFLLLCEGQKVTFFPLSSGKNINDLRFSRELGKWSFWHPENRQDWQCSHRAKMHDFWGSKLITFHPPLDIQKPGKNIEIWRHESRKNITS